MSEPMPTIPTQSPFTYPIPNSSASPSFTQDDTFMPEPIQPMPTFTQPAVHTQTNPTGQQYPNNVQSQQFQQFQTATISANNAKFPYLEKEKYEIWAMKMEYWIQNADHNLWRIYEREKTNEFTNTGLTQLEKQPPDILTHTQAPGTLEALDNVCIRYASSYNVPSIGAPTGVFVLPFGGVLASEGTPSAADVMRVDCKSRNLKSTDVAGVFQAYSALCSRGIGRRRSVNVCQTTTVSSSNFIHDNEFTVENLLVSVLTSSEATCSRGIRGRPSVNVHQNTTVCSSNFIHDIDVRNTVLPFRHAVVVQLTFMGRSYFFLLLCNTDPSTSVVVVIHVPNPESTIKTAEANLHKRFFVGRTFSKASFIRHVGPQSASKLFCGRGKSLLYCYMANVVVQLSLLDSDQRCRHCGSSFWYGECLKGHSHNQRPEYHLCCRRGSIYMQPPREPPKYIKSLFGNKHFMENIRAYNQMFAMTSFGAKIDESINAGRGPYVFKVSDQIYHWIGSLCPPPEEAPRFLQLYIYDTDNEVENRMRHFDRIHNRQQETNSGSLTFQNSRYAFTTVKSGYHTNLKLRSADGRGRAKRVTMLAYYRYQLHFRLQQYDLIFKGGRLFQQYVVGVFCVVEQNRLDFIRKKQNDIRADCFSGLYDAISRGERNGYKVGGRIIIPMSFTGGPRYMYAHYLDALAICRKLGNLQFFITFTCNVNWPEIKRFMAQYPELTASDRADVVCRVFEQKIHSFVTFLKEERIFGNVARVLYTVEFQKRGLPHCHTLLWVDSESKIKSAKDVDQYISAELPDSRVDPDGYNIVSETMMHGPCGAANLNASCMKGDKPIGESSTEASPSREMVDEIQNYVKGRFICAHEAYWRILKFDIHHRDPVVQILAMHLQDMQRITFRNKDRLRSVVDLPGKKNITLTEWFAYNASNETGRHLSYLEFPSEFMWHSNSKSWSPRRNSKSSIGRISDEVFSTWMAFGGNTRDLGSFGEETDEITDLHQILEEVLLTARGDGVAGIKRCRRDPSGDGVRDLVMASGRGRLNEDLESST
ncbi:DNA helicase [Tanacetum coccineum]